MPLVAGGAPNDQAVCPRASQCGQVGGCRQAAARVLGDGCLKQPQPSQISHPASAAEPTPTALTGSSIAAVHTSLGAKRVQPWHLSHHSVDAVQSLHTRFGTSVLLTPGKMLFGMQRMYTIESCVSSSDHTCSCSRHWRCASQGELLLLQRSSPAQQPSSHAQSE